MQIEEERSPSCRLMLRHGGDDRNVFFGVRGIEKGIESSSPRRDVSSGGGTHQCNSQKRSNADDGKPEKSFVALRREQRANPIQSTVQLYETKNTKCGHVLGRLHSLETHKRDLHREESTQGVEYAVSNI